MTPARGAAEERPAPALVDAGFALEVADAPLLHRGLGLADLAHLLDLRARRVVRPEPLARLLRAAVASVRLPAEEFPYDPAYGEVYNCRERWYVERLGDEAGWLHAGRPRREATRIALRLALRQQVAGLAREAAAFASAVADLADREAETYMPDQTYLQQAQPSTFGHYVLSFAYPALRDAERLLAGLDWVDQSPGGAGCVNGSRLLVDRQHVARLLGFGGVIEHTRDAMWQLDGLVGLLAAAASLVTSQSKLAEDLEIWASEEFDFVDLAGPYTRASVLMPQKRNPYAVAIVRGAGGVLIGRLTGFLAVAKTPSARSDNLIFAYGEVPRAIDLATRVTRLMTGVVSTLAVHPEPMWEALVGGFSQATDLAEHVMETCDVDYRTAYLIVGRAVRDASSRGLRGVDLTGELLDAAAVQQVGRPLGLAGRDLSAVLDPRAIVRTRVAPGGAAPAVVREMAAGCRSEAATLAGRSARREQAFTTAEAALVREAEEVAGATLSSR